MTASACLAFAVVAKVFAVFLAPFILWNRQIGPKVVFLVVLGLSYLPFVAQGHTEFTALAIFAREWEFNAAVFGLAKTWVDPPLVRLILATIFLLFLVSYWFHHVRQGKTCVPRGDWIFGVLLILSPVINPWYLLWILPFSVLYPTLWAWVATYSVLLSYVTWINLGNIEFNPFEHPVWVKPVEFGLVLLALLASWLRGFGSRGFGVGTRP